MATGKSTVGKLVAGRLNLAFVDTDALIESRTSRTVDELFAERGERAFRELEASVIAELCNDGAECVVALGGGAVVNPETRKNVLSHGVVITLHAEPEELAKRASQSGGRPLLQQGQPTDVLRALAESRRPAYAEAHAVIHTTNRAPEGIAEDVIALLDNPPVVVALGDRTYRVEFGQGSRARVGERARAAVRGTRALMVCDKNVQRWASDVATSLKGQGFEVATCELDPGERRKNIKSVERIWDAALAAGLDRQCLMVGVGGGVVGDLTGFAASTFLRGIAVGHVPTTVVSMADSSVGGKTGFDRKEGKNLVGTFHQPRFVLCDLETLETLAPRELRGGLAEIVKCAWLAGEPEVQVLEQHAKALRAGSPEPLLHALRMAVSLKARIVADDEHETGSRALLNLGHTIGHALEAAANYRGLLHGEAVALGMIAATRAAVRVGRSDATQLARLTALLKALGLPTALDKRLSEKVFTFVGTDKKRQGQRIRYVLPGRPGDVVVQLTDVAELPGLVAPIGGA